MLTSFFVFITMPLYFGMFITPMNNLALNDSNVSSILFSILNQAVTNPWIYIMFLLSFLASAAQSANTPNWLALITDVNFPEHRGTAFSIANIAGSLGRTLGNVGIGYLLAIVSKYAGEPNNYIITITIFQLFLIPAAMLYVIMSKSNVKDIRDVKAVLSKRAKVT